MEGFVNVHNTKQGRKLPSIVSLGLGMTPPSPAKSYTGGLSPSARRPPWDLDGKFRRLKGIGGEIDAPDRRYGRGWGFLVAGGGCFLVLGAPPPPRVSFFFCLDLFQPT